MNNYKLKEIKYNDYPILFKWANDPVTRSSSFNSEFIKIGTHKKYVKSIIEDKSKKQYIFLMNHIPVATIKENFLTDQIIELSYTVSPEYRNMKIGYNMMKKYLSNKKGSFVCKVKQSNISSIKMIEKCGFKLTSTENDIYQFTLKL